jgi:hypothetical protein
LLWNLIANIQNIHKLGDGTMNYRQQWFRRLIQNMYESNPDRGFDSFSLKVLNKEVLQIAVQQVQMHMMSNQSMGTNNFGDVSMTPASVNTNTTSLPQINTPQTTDYYNSNVEKSRKINKFNEEYGNRQREFDFLLAKPAPPTEINFKEEINDEPITNIDELIEKHRMEREREIRSFAPLSPIPEGSTTPYSNSNSNTTPRISIMNEIPTVLPTQDIINVKPNANAHSNANERGNGNSDKRVSWSIHLTENNEDSIASLRTKYNELERKYLELKNDVDKKIEDLRTLFLATKEPSSPITFSTIDIDSPTNIHV